MSIVSFSPMPRQVRDILRKARRRYRELPVTHRPALDNPTTALVLFLRRELTALALSGYWPLPVHVQRRFLGKPMLGRVIRGIKVDLNAIADLVTDLEKRGAR
ncbi:MAG: hypothetical protein K1X57_10545 [Gemmataceae bacterium]|nr:hypothetical protein [Gemmataceae bacterium]